MCSIFFHQFVGFGGRSEDLAEDGSATTASAQLKSAKEKEKENQSGGKDKDKEAAVGGVDEWGPTANGGKARQYLRP